MSDGEPGDGVTRLVPRTIPSDHDLAADFRRRTIDALDALNSIFTDAERAGFMIGFQQGKDGLGRWNTQQLHVMKKMV
jgi:hypothetical protein